VPHLEHTMVDGVFELADQRIGARGVRELDVRKMRGSAFLRGRHFYEITAGGITVYPRTEAMLATATAPAEEKRYRLAFGIPRFDEMLMGGVLSNSTTMILGAPGSGKSMLGLHFLAEGARRGERGLHFGFNEIPSRLIGKADNVGLGFGPAVADGRITVIWQPFLEEIVDVLVARVLTAVREHGIRRLFIDGFGEFYNAAIYPDRIVALLTGFSNELRSLNVTMVFSLQTEHLFDSTISAPIPGIAGVAENIIFLRYVELHSQLYRLVSIMKVQESGYDPAIREFRITSEGVDVAPTFQSAEAILTGVARALAASPGLAERPVPPGRAE
ncbi:MAG TPA: ATPase domain-containing protein, partial [Chloroflexia bacterium]|nr:ATPase domain-containing protein [Chloroflexia bacterium]